VDVATRFREYTRLEKKRTGSGLTPAELRRWVALKRMLSRTFAPEISDEIADARVSLRIPTRLSVSFTSVGEVRRSLMTNLSRGGVFIRTENPSEIGTRVDLCLHIDESGEDLRVRAEVVSHNVGPEFGADEHGMGLRFLHMDEATEKQIHDLYERSLRAVVERGEASGPEAG